MSNAAPVPPLSQDVTGQLPEGYPPTARCRFASEACESSCIFCLAMMPFPCHLSDHVRSHRVEQVGRTHLQDSQRVTVIFKGLLCVPLALVALPKSVNNGLVCQLLPNPLHKHLGLGYVTYGIHQITRCRCRLSRQGVNFGQALFYLRLDLGTQNIVVRFIVVEPL